MRIAIHIGIVNESPSQSHWQLISEVFIQLAASQPKHQFLVIGTRKIGDVANSPNLFFEEISYQKKLALAAKWWYRKQVEKAARHWKPDILLNMDTGWPPPLGMKHVLLLHPDWQLLPNYLLGEKRPGRSALNLLKQANALAVGYQWQKEKLCAKTGVSEGKIQVLGAATMPCFRPMAWAEKEAVKTSFAAGNEYFLYYGSAGKSQDIITLLKAFSQFKKRQQCNMQLLMAISGPEGNEALMQKLSSYKYREEVQVMQQLAMAEIARLSAAAYGVIAAANGQPGWWLLGTMQAGTALVAQHNSTSDEVCGAASYHLQKWETDAIAQAMMLLYKDETYRSKLIANGEQQIADQGMNTVVHGLWQCIQNVKAGK
jgi:hypothetical protein